MKDYKKGKIYKIVCNITNDIYIGSTIQTLHIRLLKHKSDAKRNKRIASSDIINRGDYMIELIENYPCYSKLELHTRERYYIENTKCINFAIPTQNMKEWRKKNEEKLILQVKDYYNKNILSIADYQKKYNQQNKKKIALQLQSYYTCECGKRIKKCSKHSHKISKRHQLFINS